MSQENAELRALAEAVYGALNAGDIDGFLAMVAEDVEFTSMVAEAEGTLSLMVQCSSPDASTVLAKPLTVRHDGRSRAVSGRVHRRAVLRQPRGRRGPRRGRADGMDGRAG